MSTSKKTNGISTSGVRGSVACLAALTIFLSAGCSMLESRKKPRIEETPPYYQDSEMDHMRAMHERDREVMSKQIHVARNKELDKLRKEVEEEKKDKEWEEDYQRTLERREKWSFWKKFKSGGDKTYMMSDEAKRIHQNLER